MISSVKGAAPVPSPGLVTPSCRVIDFISHLAISIVAVANVLLARTTGLKYGMPFKSLITRISHCESCRVSHFLPQSVALHVAVP